MAGRVIATCAYLMLLMLAEAIRKQMDLDDIVAGSKSLHEEEEAASSWIQRIGDGIESVTLDPFHPSHLGFTSLKFKLKKPKGWSLAETGQKTRNIRRLSQKEKDHWWTLENAEYSKQEAVREVWQEVNKVWDFTDNEDIRGKVDTILSHEVPGVWGKFSSRADPTFLEVFGTLLKHGCPMWMIGGTVRDLLAGREPNDVDCAGLCNSDRIRAIANKYGWVSGGSPGRPYFSIGEVHGENKEYLEGFSIDLVYDNPFRPESTVNMMMYSLTNDFVIDPSGYGRGDAEYSVYRAGSPPVDLTSERNRWGVWRQWNLNSFASSTMQRHVRYLKMRGRGWIPANNPFRANKCFQFFMGNQLLLAMLYIDNMEGVDSMNTVTRVLGPSDTDTHPAAEASILWHFADQLDEDFPAEENSKVRGMMNALKEDIEAYFAYLPKARTSPENIHNDNPDLPYGCDATAKFVGDEIDKKPRSETHPYQRVINQVPSDRRARIEKVYESPTTAANAWRRIMNAGLFYMCKYPSSGMIRLAGSLRTYQQLNLREACKAMQRSFIAITFAKDGKDGVWDEEKMDQEIHSFTGRARSPPKNPPVRTRNLFIPDDAMPNVVNINPERRGVQAHNLPRANVWNGFSPGWS